MPHIPTPKPNGFDDIVAAGRAFEVIYWGPFGSPSSTGKPAAEIAKHAGVYERLRLGLSRDIQVRDWTKKGKTVEVPEHWTFGSRLEDAMSAARVLICEAELAQQQNRCNDAALIAVECIRMGQAITRNGLLADYNCGIQIENMGDRVLPQVLPRLDADECRETIPALTEIDRGREPLNDVRRRNRIWHENTGDWFEQLFQVLVAVTSVGDRPKPCMLLQKEATTRLLIIESALQAYQLERGAPPDRLERLTPEFLAALPVDPFDPEGRSFRYVRSGEKGVVYSVGPDGDDDGGRPTIQNQGSWLDASDECDFRLDTRFAPEDGKADENDAES